MKCLALSVPSGLHKPHNRQTHAHATVEYIRHILKDITGGTHSWDPELGLRECSLLAPCSVLKR